MRELDTEKKCRKKQNRVDEMDGEREKERWEWGGVEKKKKRKKRKEEKIMKSAMCHISFIRGMKLRYGSSIFWKGKNFRLQNKY